MTPDPSLARISSRICPTLGSSPEPSACWRGTWKSRMRRPSWYLMERNARFRSNIPTVLWSAFVAMKLTAGLCLDNIVWKRLPKRLSCWVRHAVMHVGIANPRWRGKRSRHSRRMRRPQFYLSGKGPIGWLTCGRWLINFVPIMSLLDRVDGHKWYEAISVGPLFHYSGRLQLPQVHRTVLFSWGSPLYVFESSYFAALITANSHLRKLNILQSNIINHPVLHNIYSIISNSSERWIETHICYWHYTRMKRFSWYFSFLQLGTRVFTRIKVNK